MAKIDISGMEKGQRAGFVRFGGVRHLIGVRMDDEGTEIVGPKVEKEIIYFKSSNSGKVASFKYSYDDKQFKSFGNEFELGFGRWTGDRLGFFCWNEIEEAGYVDIDWFRYEYE